MTARELKKLLAGYRFDCATEQALQDGIETALADVPHEREKALSPKDRPDFMVGSVAVEVKVGGGLSALIRQLHRYASHDCVSEILVVTSRLRLANLPNWLNGKRVTAIAFTPGI
jgi:hypothetical protein